MIMQIKQELDKAPNQKRAGKNEPPHKQLKYKNKENFIQENKLKLLKQNLEGRQPETYSRQLPKISEAKESSLATREEYSGLD